MINAIVFDLDGTLLDTITTITYYVNLALKREGIGEVSEQECKYFAGNGAKTLIRRAVESRGVYDEDIIYRVREYYNSKYNSDTLYLTEPYSQIRELLKALKEKNVKLAVLSNKPDDATRDIIPSFFPDTFDVVHGGREGVALKPAPDALYEVYKELGVTADEVIYVGDTNVDMQTGKNGGAKITVGVLWGFRTREELTQSGADVLIESPLELLQLIG